MPRKYTSLCLFSAFVSQLALSAADVGEVIPHRVLPIVNQELSVRFEPQADAELPETASLTISFGGKTVLQEQIRFADSATLKHSFTPTETGYYEATVDFGRGIDPVRKRIPVVWRDLYFLVWGPPEPPDRHEYGLLTTQMIHTGGNPEVIRYWKDHGSDVVAWIGAPRSDETGEIPDADMNRWCDRIGELLEMGCDGVFIDEFGAYPNPYGLVRMRSISAMMKKARERFPDVLLMPATAGALQRELSIGYKEAGAVALLEMYPTCMTRFFASHTVERHLDWRVEMARNTDLIHHVDQPQTAIVLLGTRMIGAHEEPVVAEVEQFVRYIRKTAPEMPGIGFYGLRYDGMTKELARMVEEYFVKPLVDVRAIRFAPYSATAGQPVDVLVALHNLGGMTARDIKVKVYAAEFGTGQKDLIGTIAVNRIGLGHRVLTQSEATGEPSFEYQQVDNNRYAVSEREVHNVIFLARTTGKISWTPKKKGYYTITAEVQPSETGQYSILDGAVQETLLVQ